MTLSKGHHDPFCLHSENKKSRALLFYTSNVVQNTFLNRHQRTPAAAWSTSMSQDGEDDKVDDHAAQTYMAVALCKGTLGVAWYDSTCGEVRFAVLLLEVNCH